VEFDLYSHSNIDSQQGFAQCSILLNMEFERVFYKNSFAAGAALLNLYMICKLDKIEFDL